MRPGDDHGIDLAALRRFCDALRPAIAQARAEGFRPAEIVLTEQLWARLAEVMGEDPARFGPAQILGLPVRHVFSSSGPVLSAEGAPNAAGLTSSRDYLLKLR